MYYVYDFHCLCIVEQVFVLTQNLALSSRKFAETSCMYQMHIKKTFSVTTEMCTTVLFAGTGFLFCPCGGTEYCDDLSNMGSGGWH